jgi:hypothetical protein
MRSALSFVRDLAFGVIALGLSTLNGSAQTIGVQSGEHAGFTRLVLDIGAEREWTLSREGDGHRLALDPPVDGFAIGQVFDLIPRTRLAALEVREGLLLSLACDCDINASRFEGRYLILDIAPTEGGAPQPAQPVASTPEGDAAVAAVRRQAAAESLPDMTRVLTGAAARSDAVVIAPPPLAAAPSAMTADIDLAEAARIMSEQLARAAASGLLEATPGRPLSDADPVQAPEATTDIDGSNAGDASPALPNVSEEPGPGAPIRAETALDVALHRALGAEPQRNQLICSGDALSIRDWSPGDGVYQGLGALRIAVFDDRDGLQRDAVLALARHYLFYGFGAEAAYWLGQIEAAPEELSVIAALVDGVDGAHFPPEPDPVTCSDEELLWRYLDGALGAHPLTEEQVGRLQRAAAALPAGLRDQIAPRVSRLLQADGYPHAARNLRDMLVRGGRLPDAMVLGLDLDLGIAQGADPATRDALALAIRDDGGDPVPGMAHALAFDREMGVPTSEIRLEAAEALLREYGIGPETASLWQEVMLAHAASGEIDRVFDLMAGAGDVPDVTRDEARTALFSDRLSAGDTAALFIFARLFGSDWRGEGSVAGRTRVAAMAHLREAGLTDAAEVLRAGQRLLILPARPGTTPDEADLLRAAWQGGDWARLAEVADGAHHDIALRMVELGTNAAAEPTPRAEVPDLRALVERVEDSQALRAEIVDLLGAPVPRLVEAAE